MYKVSLSKFIRRGFRCSTCSGKAGLTYENAKREFDKIGYKLLTDEYSKAIDKLPFVCDKGHKHEMSLNNLKRGQRCGKCFEEFELGRSSRSEKKLSSYLSLLGLQYRHRDRKLIFPYELDFYFPKQKVAIEYCGLYWHSEDVGKGKDYHYKKMSLCREKGIRLITIFEDEYLERPEVVLSRIKNALGVSNYKIYARNCCIKPIVNELARGFLKDNHLQGAGHCKVAFGLYFSSELVGVLTGGALSRSHVSKNKVFELKRLAFCPNTTIIGGASRLFKCFKQYCVENNYQEIRTYCDMRWGNPFNPVYEKLGFKLLTETKYTPHYFKGQKRYRNQFLRKTPEERKTGKTEWQLRQEQGFRRLWDCGHRTYIYNLAGDSSVGKD